MPLQKLMAGCFFLLAVVGCGVFKNSPKYGFSEGYYRSRLFHKKEKRVYVVPTDDSVKVYTAKALQKESIDTTASLKIAFPAGKKPLAFPAYHFHKNTFDVDVLTIPVKFRPAVSGFPPQLNATFNGAVYLGYRNDVYKLAYHETPLRIFRRSITHYGYSVGLFTGLGMARIDEYVTRNNLAIQYDGAVSTTGFALIVAVDNLSVGLAIGVDHLVDKNRRYWVNEGKPWMGIGFGLNLN